MNTGPSVPKSACAQSLKVDRDATNTAEGTLAVQLDTASNTTRILLEQFSALVAGGQWSDAVEAIRRIIEQHGHELIAADERRVIEFPTYIRVSDYCHRRLSDVGSNHSELLATYRRRVDSYARRLFDQGRADRDVSPLEQLVTVHFNSSWADDALDMLAEIALEQGHYHAARDYWERIHGGLRVPTDVEFAIAGRSIWFALRDADFVADGDAIINGFQQPLEASYSWLAYPDSDIPLADVLSRLVLVSILEGNRPRAAIELRLLQLLHPDATGRLGGQQLNLADALGGLLQGSASWPAPIRSNNWTTFARNTQRNSLADTYLDISPNPVWSVDLDTEELDRLTEQRVATELEHGFPPVRPGERQRAICHHHPIVVGNSMYFNDSDRVHVVDVPTGSVEEIYPRGAVESRSVPIQRWPHVGAARFTLSAHAGRLYARMGMPVTRFLSGSRQPKKSPGYLLGWNLATKKLLFEPIVPDGPIWSFEGTPVANESYLYVSMRRTDVQSEPHVACYDLLTQKLRWRTRICSTQSVGRGLVEEVTHNLLTLNEQTIYVNTNHGVIAAVSILDGQIKWMMRYPRDKVQSRTGTEQKWYAFRDLNPCVFWNGLLYVAPADHEQVLAIDAASGELIWRTSLTRGMLDVVHLLGAADGQLIASGRRLWWLDAFTGQLSSHVSENPFPNSDNPIPLGFGRGVIGGDRVYWPARGEQDEIFIFDRQTGQRVRQPIAIDTGGAAAGNLMIAGNHLFVATPDKIFAFSEAGSTRDQ